MTPDERAAIIERAGRMTPAERAAELARHEAAVGAKPVTHRGLFAIVREILGTLAGVNNEAKARDAAIEARLAALEARPAAMKYCGVFTTGQTYRPGEFVTHSGSVWACRQPTDAAPDEHTREGARDWQLAVKRGREGKPGRDGRP